jgi:hypothetical protein
LLSLIGSFTVFAQLLLTDLKLNVHYVYHKLL